MVPAGSSRSIVRVGDLNGTTDRPPDVRRRGRGEAQGDGADQQEGTQGLLTPQTSSAHSSATCARSARSNFAARPEAGSLHLAQVLRDDARTLEV
jgi:hypothetical protein